MFWLINFQTFCRYIIPKGKEDFLLYYCQRYHTELNCWRFLSGLTETLCQLKVNLFVLNKFEIALSYKIQYFLWCLIGFWDCIRISCSVFRSYSECLNCYFLHSDRLIFTNLNLLTFIFKILFLKSGLETNVYF